MHILILPPAVYFFLTCSCVDAQDSLEVRSFIHLKNMTRKTSFQKTTNHRKKKKILPSDIRFRIQNMNSPLVKIMSSY